MNAQMDWTALLTEHFGFNQFRPGQERVLQALDNTSRALAVFPTGAGKSLCYQLPALNYEGLTLVISPLIALMKDQIDFLHSRGIEAGRLDSSLSFEEARVVQDKIRTKVLKILYVSPERFKNERFVDMIQRQKISLFAVDEAHCISEWGHNFRPDYLKLAETAKGLRAERILALTATATPAVVKDICAAFNIPDDAAIVTGFYRKNLKVQITATNAGSRDALLLNRLQSRPAGPTIVYVTLQKTAYFIADMLRRAGLPAEAYHAGMDTEDRSAVQERWMASDRGIVVATIAFGMGIDKSDVRYVYHYNLPKSIENYSQEIGRAGRDEKESIVEMLACADDIPTLENFVYGDTPTAESIEALVSDVLSLGPQFDVSLYELSDKHDIRMLVLKTALTYLELLGVLREGSPFYAGYRFQPLTDVGSIVRKFEGERSQFVASLFKAAKKGTKWYTMNPDTAAVSLNQPRQRIIKALDYLYEQHDILLEASEVRNRFTRIADNPDIHALASGLVERFASREKIEIDRTHHLIRLIEQKDCQVNSMAAYFGELRNAPCGDCIPCKTGSGTPMPVASARPSLPGGLDMQKLAELRAQNPVALKLPRQAARFLCGLSSPAITRAKLTRNELFGVWEDRPFRQVLDYLAG